MGYTFIQKVVDLTESVDGYYIQYRQPNGTPEKKLIWADYQIIDKAETKLRLSILEANAGITGADEDQGDSFATAPEGILETCQIANTDSDWVSNSGNGYYTNQGVSTIIPDTLVKDGQVSSVIISSKKDNLLVKKLSFRCAQAGTTDLQILKNGVLQETIPSQAYTLNTVYEIDVNVTLDTGDTLQIKDPTSTYISLFPCRYSSTGFDNDDLTDESNNPLTQYTSGQTDTYWEYVTGEETPNTSLITIDYTIDVPTASVMVLQDENGKQTDIGDCEYRFSDGTNTSDWLTPLAVEVLSLGFTPDRVEIRQNNTETSHIGTYILLVAN